MLDDVVDHDIQPLMHTVSQNVRVLPRQILFLHDLSPDRIIYIMVYVGNFI